MLGEQDKADFRRAVRAHLAERPSVSQAPATIHRHAGREFAATLQDTIDACVFLELSGHLTSHHDPMGGKTLYYQATAAGVLAHERGQ